MSCGCRRSSCGLGRTAICGRAGASARTGPRRRPRDRSTRAPLAVGAAGGRARRQGRGQSLARRLINEDPAGILPVFVRREPGGAPSCFRVWHRVDGTHTSPAVLCFRSRWPAGPGSIDAAGVALSRKGAKSRTGGRNRSEKAREPLGVSAQRLLSRQCWVDWPAQPYLKPAQTI